MHGLGNDFVVFDARKQGLALDAAAARAIADRRRGVGCDQVIVIERGVNGADAFMRIFNADGGEVESCGNAARCVAHLLMEEKDRDSVRIDTLGGALVCTGAGGGMVTVDMGAPNLMWDEVPLARPADTNRFALNVDGTTHMASAVSVGNPHCVLFVDDADAAPVASLGPRIETHPMFPKRTNVEFVSVRDRGHLRMRVWERGSGITHACGSGTCAAAVAAHRRGLTDTKIEVELDGGVLAVELRVSDDHILMTGPTALSFHGEIDFAGLQP
ncbi:MAG: diaminopimelate epimerase [Alphaproteobacteria bacterium]|nr:diaminopimelate epimerase [Alphaproteobacteria bacterium]MDE2111020.1 diaminopimelate epimerase [Alphaproteobacteria bacterium]MDE2493819.1 diaminopimelate epimerase [Alphaproteobacteria bacterium]